MGKYATSITKSRIHNFRSYLVKLRYDEELDEAAQDELRQQDAAYRDFMRGSLERRARQRMEHRFAYEATLRYAQDRVREAEADQDAAQGWRSVEDHMRRDPRRHRGRLTGLGGVVQPHEQSYNGTTMAELRCDNCGQAKDDVMLFADKARAPSRRAEYRLRHYLEFVTEKEIGGFPKLCTDCQREIDVQRIFESREWDASPLPP